MTGVNTSVSRTRGSPGPARTAKRPAKLAKVLAAAVAAVPGGVARPGQQAMAEAVAQAVGTREHLLVQAGTGTGKSLAYLVPALLVGAPVVISTATLALQSQLVEHDLPRLVDAVAPLLGRRPTFAVLKGRHHYLCAAKLAGAGAEEPADLFATDDPSGGSGSGAAGGPAWLGESGRLGKAVARIRTWADETEHGDRDELDPGVDERAWRLVSMPARECVGAVRCPFGEGCFAEASRTRAREVDLVVTNHSLLAFDLLAGRHIIPPHELLVIDEAHELAERVSSASQAELTPDMIDRAARQARTLLEGEAHQRLGECATALAAGLDQSRPGRLIGTLPAALGEALTMVDAATRAAATSIGEVGPEDPDPVRKQQVRAVLLELGVTAQRIISWSDDDVVWVERDERRRAVVVAPLSVAGTLRRLLFRGRTVVATSATLALGGDFDTIARALGLVAPAVPAVTPAAPAPAPVASAPVVHQRARESTVDHKANLAWLDHASSDDPLREGALPDGDFDDIEDFEDLEDDEEPVWRCLDVGSPFEYRKQGILYVAAHLPRPTASGLADPAAAELVRLVSALGGRTLGLFSSRRAAEQAAVALRAQTELTILLQGEEALPLLVKRFRAEPSTCLLGVMSLWQGVDVPGEACQLVVIDRLPFPRPDEPLSSARSAAVDSSGGSGFAAVSVPIAAVRLAQGVGRLIRTSTDRGVVAVLDSRLATSRSYGPFLRKSLPPFWYTTDSSVVTAALRRLAVTPAGSVADGSP